MEHLKVIILIKKMLSSTLKPSERISLSEEKPMKRYLSQQWEQRSDTYLKDKVDSSEIWDRIIESCWGEIKSKPKRFRLHYLSAGVIALLLLSAWTINYLFYSYVDVVAPSNQKITLTLPDNSKVWLNAGSTIRYRKFFPKNRKVELKGEAFFDVESIPSHPFKVYFNDACVKVKGTEFNIRSDALLAKITLYSGHIEFQPEGKSSIPMNPKECIIYTVDGQGIEQKNIDTEYDWRNDEYRFVDKPMEELVHFINNHYKVHLHINDPLYTTYLFSGNIARSEELLDVLEKICLTMDMKFRQENDTIVLY